LADAPSDLAIIGRYALTPDIFDLLDTLEPGPSGEVLLTDALSSNLSSGAKSVMAGLPPKERVSMALASPDFMRR
jgi:UTP-glucose-1-phosphate uridylyltransferase